MGCNIHGHIEVRQYPEHSPNYWYSVHPITNYRNYIFYAVIADVRNGFDLPIISKPKGLPNDVGMMAKIDSKEMGLDGHSHSWLTYDELLNYTWIYRTPDFVVYDEVHPYFKALMSELDCLVNEFGVENVRVVFWFDN